MAKNDRFVKVIDLGYKRLVDNTERLEGVGLTVGIHEDASPYDGGLSVAQVYAVHEFGTRDKRIPARPTLGPTFDDNESEYVGLAAQIAIDVGDGAMPEMLVQRLALKMEADVKRAITELREPANKPATIAAKGSDNPLIDTSRMRNSVQGRVVDGEVSED